MILFVKSIICKFRGHSLEHAGTCPFTGATYYHCDKCSMMIPVDVVQ